MTTGPFHRIIRRAVMALARCFLILVAAGGLCHGRPIHDWSYEELLREADVVVIARLDSTEDVENDEAFYPHCIAKQITTFEPQVFFKGETVEKIELIHFREMTQTEAKAAQPTRRVPEYGIMNGPNFLELERPIPTGDEGKSTASYLLFLKRRDDGKYEPVSGRDDPGFAVRRLPPSPLEPDDPR